MSRPRPPRLARPTLPSAVPAPGVLAVLLGLLLPADVAPQTSAATLAGAVRTPTGEAVAGVLVLLDTPDQDAFRRTRTGPSGAFRFRFLPAGTYRLRVERIGFRPVTVENVELDTGAELFQDVVLEPGREGRDVLAGSRATAVGAPWPWPVLGQRSPLLPSRARLIREALPLAPGVTDISVEGLPLEWLTTGITARGALYEGRAGSAGLLPGALVGRAVVRSLPDVEWRSATGLAAGVVPGESGVRQGFVMAGEQDALYDDQGPAGAELFAAATFGSTLDDNTRLSGGAAWHRSARSIRPAPELLTGLGEMRDAARNAHGVSIPAWEPEVDRFALTAGLVVEATPRSRLRLDGLLAGSFQPGAPSPLAEPWDGTPQRTAAAQGSYVALLRNEELRLETRVGLRWNDTERDEVGAPRTLVADAPVAIGDRRPDRDERVFSLSQSARFDRGPHQIKAGVEYHSRRGSYRVDPRGEPTFLFGSTDAFAGATGFAATLSGPGARATVSLPRGAVFLQDTWNASERFRVLGGARLVLDVLPVSDIELDRSWFFATGEANTELEQVRLGIEPRLGADLRLDARGYSRAFASATVHLAPIDPRAMAELVGNDGDLAIRRAAGDLGSWPGDVAGPQGTSLTLPGGDLDPARTARLEIGLEHRLSPRLSARVSGVYRRTDDLLSRTEANATANPWGSGQGGRTVLAPLVLHGGVIGAAPAAWLTLPGFDRVWRFDQDASSRYFGLNAELRYQGPRGLLLEGRYTFSRTRDDWASPAFPVNATATPSAYLFPVAGTAREQGVSDLDIPHRVVGQASLPLPLPGRPELGVLYTFRSGLPFTPAMGHGIDADGDGLANDPAFVDAAVAGLASLVDQWPCLDDQAGRLADRNSCRSDGVHRLDLALAAGVIRTGSLTARLRVEALGLLGTRSGVVDAALYRPAGPPNSTPGSTVAIPVEANDGFGSVLVDHGPVRSLRLGAELRF